MAVVERLKENTQGNDWVVGDIHAHVTRLRAAMRELSFNPAVDRLIGVGDLVDRGSETEEVLVLLQEPWFYSTMGNHDDFAVRIDTGRVDIERYIEGGGQWNVDNSPEERQRFADAFRDLPFAIEIETPDGLLGVVHADCPAPTWQEFVDGLRAQTQGPQAQHTPMHDCMWNRNRYKRGDHEVIPDVKAVIVGHCCVPTPKTLGNVHYIDTGGWTSRRTFTFMRASDLVTITVRTKE